MVGVYSCFQHQHRFVYPSDKSFGICTIGRLTRTNMKEYFVVTTNYITDSVTVGVYWTETAAR